MASTPFDPAAYKAQQREEWSNAASGWRRRWPAFEQAAQPLSDRMLELAHIALGMRVLDVATGIGEPAMTVARRVGTGGTVVALDQAPQMLAIARERMRDAGLSNVEFIEGDAETLALLAGSFDAVVCRWAVFFFPDPVGTLARLRATLVAGGWFVAAVWGPPERVPLIALTFRALASTLGQPPARPAGPSPFAYSEPAALAQVARDAGFTEVQTEPFTVTFVFSSVEEYLGHIEDVSATGSAMLARQSPERRAEFQRQLAAAVGPYTDASGQVRLPNDCLLVAGRR